LKKALNVDLSCNQIREIPDTFCTQLSRLIYVDLSKNFITELPSDIDKLVRLKKLDLFKNQIKTLPVGFGKMPQLQWLDLKDNPLEAPFSGFAGDCLDDGACRQCAKNVRENMAVLGLELDKRNRIKQKQKLKNAEKKRLEAAQAAVVAREQLKLQKKMEKEKRRREWNASQQESVSSSELSAQGDTTEGEQSKLKKQEAGKNGNKKKHQLLSNSKQMLRRFLCFAIIAVLLGILVGTAQYYCEENPLDEHCRSSRQLLQRLERQLYVNKMAVMNYVERKWYDVSKLMRHYGWR